MGIAAVEAAIKKLSRENLIVINPGGIKGPNQSRYFQMTEEGWELAETKPVLKIGSEDADSFGLPAALLLGHLEYRDEKEENFITVAKASEYIGLNMRTVQRDLKRLFAEEVIIESPFRQKKRLRYFQFNSDHGRKRVQESRLSTRGTEKRSGCPPSDEEMEGAACGDDLDCEILRRDDESTIPPPAIPMTSGKLTFSKVSSTTIHNPLAAANHSFPAPSLPELESIVVRGKPIIDGLRPEQILTILQGSTEEVHELVTSLVRSNDQDDPAFTDFLLEALTVALLISRNPGIDSSHVRIRRAAYRLTLFLQPRLEENVRYREAIFESLTEGNFADATLPANEKVKLLEEAVSVMNSMGIIENAPQKYEAPNPVILLNQISFGSGGTARAMAFFAKNTDCSVAQLVHMIRRESQPKPDSKGKPKHAQLNLSGLFTNFRKLEAARQEY